MSGPTLPTKLSLDLLLRWLRAQPVPTLVSYACALPGAWIAIHDYRHYNSDRFGYSTPLLAAAIMLYVLGQRRSR